MRRVRCRARRRARSPGLVRCSRWRNGAPPPSAYTWAKGPCWSETTRSFGRARPRAKSVIDKIRHLLGFLIDDCERTRSSRNVVARLPLSFATVVSKSARPQPQATPQHTVWELACKSSGLQTLSIGCNSQIIGAKEQGPKRACGCALAYMMLANPSPIAEQL